MGPHRQGAKNNFSVMIAIIGWAWTGFGGLILLTSIFSCLIGILQRQIHMPNINPPPFKHLLFQTTILFCTGAPIIVASQFMIKRNIWGLITLRFIIAIFILYNIYSLTFGHQFPTYQSLHTPNEPPLVAHIAVFFSRLVISIWGVFFAASLTILSLPRAKGEFTQKPFDA